LCTNQKDKAAKILPGLAVYWKDNVDFY